VYLQLVVDVAQAHILKTKRREREIMQALAALFSCGRGEKPPGKTVLNFRTSLPFLLFH